MLRSCSATGEFKLEARVLEGAKAQTEALFEAKRKDQITRESLKLRDPERRGDMKIIAVLTHRAKTAASVAWKVLAYASADIFPSKHRQL
jgi:hypothetical protein